MPDREKVIKHFEHLLNAAKGNYQDFVDLTVDVGEEILALLKEQQEEIENLKQTAQGMMEGVYLLKEQEAVVRCKDCKHHLECDYWIENGDDWFCADGEKKDD